MRVTLKIEVNPALIEKVGKKMPDLDFGISGVRQIQEYIVSFDITTSVKDDYITNLKKGLIEIIEEDGTQVISIERVGTNTHIIRSRRLPLHAPLPCTTCHKTIKEGEKYYGPRHGGHTYYCLQCGEKRWAA